MKVRGLHHARVLAGQLETKEHHFVHTAPPSPYYGQYFEII